MKTVLRLLAFLRPSAGLAALSILLGVGTVASGIGLAATSAYLISAAALQPSIAALQVAIVGVRFFGLLRGGFRYLERLASHSVNFRLVGELQSWFYRQVEPLAPAGLQEERGGDLLSRAIGDIISLEDFYVRVAAPPLTSLVVLAGMLVFLGQFSASFAWVLLVTWTLVGLALPLVVHGLSLAPGMRVIEERARLQAALVDGIQGMGDLLAYGRGDQRLETTRRLGLDLARTQGRLAWINGMQTAMSGLLAHLGTWAVLVLAIPLVRSGRLEGTLLAVVVLASLASFEAAAPLPLAAQLLGSSLAAARRLFDLAGRPSPIHEPQAPLPPSPDALLEVSGLTFRYRPDQEPALRQVSFRLEPGRHVAIVGPSGAGKSTLAGLFLRFWEFQEGDIRLGGQDIRQMDSQDVRRAFGMVAQSTYLFDATLHQNLRLGNPNASPEAQASALHAACLEEFIAGLPMGVETWVGEHGLRLSGGERQRVAVARAILQDAPILILDEPTSGLDPPTEERLLERVLDARRGRSLLLITHRLVAMERLDEILVLSGGRVAERGTHAGLLQINGLYRKIWEIQQQALQG